MNALMRLDAMHEPRRQQKVQRAINRGRRRARMNLAHFVEQRIRLSRAARIEQQFEHFAAKRRELLAAFAAILFGKGERRFG